LFESVAIAIMKKIELGSYYSGGRSRAVIDVHFRFLEICNFTTLM